jgi:hypothetical protein
MTADNEASENTDAAPVSDRTAAPVVTEVRPGCAGSMAPFLVGALVLAAVGGGLLLGRCTAPDPTPPPAVTVVNRGTPVVTAIRDLARLESAQYHMERVIELREQQKRLFGLVETEDAILLVAAAKITAGVDLAQIGEKDIVIDVEKSRVEITLPPVKVLEATLDNERTHVYLRDTDLLAERKESLETRARQEAEKELVQAATEAGILKRAEDNSRRTIENLVRALGYQHVIVRFRDR